MTLQTVGEIGEAKVITIYNIYNPGATKYEDSTLPILNEALHSGTGEKIILGDFNLHHEMWAGTNITSPDTEAIHLITLL